MSDLQYVSVLYYRNITYDNRGNEKHVVELAEARVPLLALFMD